MAAGLFYAFGGPLLNPVFAGAAMAFSSVSVVSNSLSLKKFKFKRLGGKDANSTIAANTSTVKEKIMEYTITVEGMSCQHCKNHVEKAALGVDGIISAEVSLEKKELKIAFADGKDNIDEVKKAVTEAGYTAV